MKGGRGVTQSLIRGLEALVDIWVRRCQSATEGYMGAKWKYDYTVMKEIAARMHRKDGSMVGIGQERT